MVEIIKAWLIDWLDENGDWLIGVSLFSVAWLLAAAAYCE